VAGILQCARCLYRLLCGEAVMLQDHYQHHRYRAACKYVGTIRAPVGWDEIKRSMDIEEPVPVAVPSFLCELPLGPRNDKRDVRETLGFPGF
jgi:hypothetical protein